MKTSFTKSSPYMLRWQRSMASFFIICFCYCSLSAHGQQYCLAAYKVPGYNNDSVLQYVLININPYGAYEGRVRLSNASKTTTQANTVLLTEKPEDSTSSSPDLRFLYADSMVLSSDDDPYWTSTRFVFKWQTADRDALASNNQFVLENVEYRDCFGNWVAPVNKQIFNYNAATIPRTTLERFYSKDELSSHILPLETKGVLTTDFRNAAMHLFIVANTSDPDIGEAAKKDVANITKTFEEIALNLGLSKPFVHSYSGTNFTKAKVKSDLEKLKVNSRDIVIFYYTGHGFRWQQDDTKFPRIDFNTPNKPFDKNNSLKIADVNNILLNKKAHFTLVLSDCCNRDVPSRSTIGPQSLGTRNVRLPFDFNNAKRLFFPTERTNVIATAAMPQELAGCNPKEGSYFTINFYLTLLYGTSTHPAYKNATWNSMLSEVRKFTTDRGKTASLKQTVYWD